MTIEERLDYMLETTNHFKNTMWNASDSKKAALAEAKTVTGDAKIEANAEYNRLTRILNGNPNQNAVKPARETLDKAFDDLMKAYDEGKNANDVRVALKAFRAASKSTNSILNRSEKAALVAAAKKNVQSKQA